MKPEREVLDHIPIVDLETIGSNSFNDVPDTLWIKKSKEIHSALTNIGFVYLTNHGVPLEKIQRVFDSSKAVFFISDEEKEAIKYNNDVTQGFVLKGQELLHPSSKYEIREAYDVSRFDRPFPSCVPHLKEALQDYTSECLKLNEKILKLMAIALDLEPDFFNKTHKRYFQEGNGSIMRVIRYPPITEEVGEGVVRCGEHSDYGAITILAQDDAGGLEVKNVDGSWVKATPVAGSLLINLGDLMEFWTNGKYPATRHRILVPTEESLRNKERYSMAFFIHPTDDTSITPIGQIPDENNTTSAGEYLKSRLYATYKY